MRIKNYNPVKLIIGLWAIAVGVRRCLTAKKKYPVPLIENDNLSKNNFIVDYNHFAENEEFNGFVELIKQEFDKKEDSHGIITVVNNKFINGFRANGSAYYLSNKVLPLSGIIKIIESSDSFKILERHIGCQFYCRSISVFKTDSRATGSTSTFFHRDGHPPFNYKILVYLTDVLEIEYGPTALIKGSASNVIPGWGKYTYDRPFSELLYRENVVLGKVGSAILFSTNVRHAGGRMLKGERVVMTVQVVPRYSKEITSFLSCSLHDPGSREYDL